MFKDFWNKAWAWALIIIALGFAIESNVSVAIRNRQDNQQVQSEQNLIGQLTTQNQKLALLIDYYNSPSYQDVAARERLGMKLPSETVYAVKGLPSQDTDQTDNLNSVLFQDSSSQAIGSSTTSNLTKWLDYFQGKK